MTEAASTQGTAELLLRNVAELAQRQQARELGSSLARHVFRLLKVAQFHALDNMAFLQQVDHTVEALAAFGSHTGEPLSLLFTKSTVFVNGQLLKASRAEYEAALELSDMVRRLGVTQLTIQNDANRTDLKSLARLFQPGSRAKAENGVLEASPRIRLRYVHAARLDENDNELSPEEQVLRTYATAVVVMRRVYENLSEARYQLPNQVKRLAQRLVVLSEGDTPAFLGVTGMRNLNHDAAGRAVNRSILAVSMGRQLTDDLATLSRIAMAALFYDVAVPLVTGTAGAGEQTLVAQMTEDAERRLPAATAVVLTALGHVREASLVRTVIAFEAHWVRQQEALGPLYDGAHRPMVAARIVATAHRFNELLEPDLAASTTRSVDDAVSLMRGEAKDALDHAMLVLLVGALGVFPRGSPVEISTGEKAVVLQTPDNPADYTRPTVRLVYDAGGQLLRAKVVLDLATDPERQVTRIITDPDPALREACAAVQGAVVPRARQSIPPSAVGRGMAGASPNSMPTRPPPEGTRPSAPAPRIDSSPSSRSGASARRIDSTPSVRRAVSEPRIDSSSGVPSSGRRRFDGASGAPRSDPPRFDSTAPSTPRRFDSRPSVPAARRPSMPPRSVPPGSERGSAVEVVEAPPSRRDPRSEEWNPEPGAEENSGPSSTGHGVRRESLMWRARAASLPPKQRPVSSSRFSHSHAPSASGGLDRTPFSHLLLYVADRSLGGTLVLTEPDASEQADAREHAIFFKGGMPTKAFVHDRVAALGPTLVALGALEQSQLESVASGLSPDNEAALERELIDLGLAPLEQIADARNEQLDQRLSSLFLLPATTRFAFYNGVDLLQPVWGNIPGALAARAALVRGLREHPEEAAMERVLEQSARGPLQMCSGAPVEDFEFDPDELGVIISIANGTPSMNDLVEAGHDPAVVRRVVYVLLLGRCATPVGGAPASQ